MSSRQRLATLVLLISSLASTARTAPPTLTLHVSRSTTVHGSEGNPFLRLTGSLDGKKVELESEKMANSVGTWRPTVLEPGDYSVHLLNEDKRDGGIRRTYELDLGNGKTAKYFLVGLSE